MDGPREVRTQGEVIQETNIGVDVDTAYRFGNTYTRWRSTGPRVDAWIELKTQERINNPRHRINNPRHTLYLAATRWGTECLTLI